MARISVRADGFGVIAGQGEINISPDNIQALWIPDVIIHDLVKFSKPEILNEVAALEIFSTGQLYYKIR